MSKSRRKVKKPRMLCGCKLCCKILDTKESKSEYRQKRQLPDPELIDEMKR